MSINTNCGWINEGQSIILVLSTCLSNDLHTLQDIIPLLS